MKPQNHFFNRLYRFSLRKTRLGVGSVVVGLFLAGSFFGAQEVLAAEVDPQPVGETLVETDPAADRPSIDELGDLSSSASLADEASVPDVSLLEGAGVALNTSDAVSNSPTLENNEDDTKAALLEEFNRFQGMIDSLSQDDYTPESFAQLEAKIDLLVASISKDVVDETEVLSALEEATIAYTSLVPAAPKTVVDNSPTVENQTLVLENTKTSRHFKVENGQLHTYAIENKLTGEKIELADNSKEFSIAFKVEDANAAITLIPGSVADDKRQLDTTKLRLAQNGISREKTADGERIVFTFNPKHYKGHEVSLKYIVELKEGATFSRSHLELAIPEVDNKSLEIDYIDLQSLTLKNGKHIHDFSKQKAISEMSGFKGFYAGLGQPVYIDSFFTGSEFPIALNTVQEDTRTLVSRYYAGKSVDKLGLDENGVYRTWDTVFGVARSNDYQVIQQDFYHYLAQIGQKTYFRKQYNSWFDHMKDITADNIKSSFNEIERGFTNGGVSPLDSYVVDDGWQEIESLWAFNNKFPNKLYDSSKQVKRFGSDFGLWLGPQGGYGGQTERMARWLERNNLGSLNKGVIYIGDKRYTDGLVKLFKDYETEFDVNYWKLDGLLLNPKSRTDEFGVGGGYENMYSMTETHERWIKLYETIRANTSNPDKMWINLTSYIPPSPWFLQWVNSIWMQNAGDVDYQDGVKKAAYRHLDFGNDAEEAITYRDDRYEELVKLRKWQLPFANIYNHDPVYGNTAHTSKSQEPGGPARQKINFSTEDLRNYLYMLGTRGTGFWEFYYSSSMMDDEKWQVNGEVVKWIEANYDTLKHAVFHGGKPGHGEVYGYSAWDDHNGILSIRNPIDKEQDYTITLDRLVGLREGTVNMYRTTVHGDKRHDTEALTQYGDKLTIRLKPYEAVVFQYAKEADTRPSELLTSRVRDSHEILLEFDERVVLTDKTSFTVANHTVTGVKLEKDFRTVILTLDKALSDREMVTVTYANLEDNAARPNLSEGHVTVTAYSHNVVADIASVRPGVVLDQEGITGKGEFSVTVKASLNKLGQLLASQKDQWQLSVDNDGRIVFDVKGAKVTSAPFATLRADDKGEADRLVTVGKEVVITAVRAKNGSLKLYVDGQLHNSAYDKGKGLADLALSELVVGTSDLDGHVSRFVLEVGARDFETADKLYNQLSPQPRKVSVPLDKSGTQATSFDPNDGGPRPAEAAIDGNASSYWVSATEKDNRVEPQRLTIALEKPTRISEVVYSPRTVAAKAVGNIKKAILEYSLDGTTWESVVTPDNKKEIVIPETVEPTSITFNPVEAKFFRLTALETHHWQDGSNGQPDNRNKVVAVAELTPVVIEQPEVQEVITIAYLRNLLGRVSWIERERYSGESLEKLDTAIESARSALTSHQQNIVDSAYNELLEAVKHLRDHKDTEVDVLVSKPLSGSNDKYFTLADTIKEKEQTAFSSHVNPPHSLLGSDESAITKERQNTSERYLPKTSDANSLLPILGTMLSLTSLVSLRRRK